jgi:hypothetical protein
MPPRYAYWTIIAGGLPTAFRAAERDELLPTFQRIKEKHPDAEMKFFARGKLWESREAARTAQRPAGARARDWRPGGNHRDPRQKFIDAKKQRNAAIREQRWERKHDGSTQPARDGRNPQGGTPPLRDQGIEEPQPPRPRGPNREPHPSEKPEPTPPPHADQPIVPPPGPPERGHRQHRRPFQPRGKFPKGPRR